MKRLYLVTFCLLIGTGLIAQEKLKSFTPAADVFINELSGFLLNTPNKTYKENSEQLLIEFTEKWNAGRFSAEQKDSIYSVANRMLERGMRAHPQFYEFTVCLNHFTGNQQPARSIIAWLYSLNSLIDERTFRKFDEFLESTDDLFERKIIYKTSSIQWKYYRGKFYYSLDTVPVIVFERLFLICASRKDSSVIKKTKGVYLIDENRWIGEGGTVSWNRFGINEDKVFAEIGDYDISLRSPEFTIDSAVFYNRYYLKEPLVGSFNEKVFSSPPSNRTSYPRFESYLNNLELNDIFENINFSGGLGMEGSKLLCKGDPGIISIYNADKDLVSVVESSSFIIQDDKISSYDASASIYFAEDSVFHPGLQMKYDHEGKRLNLLRSTRGVVQSPFYNSYHKLDMYCEALEWIIDKPLVSFEMIKGVSKESKAVFESINRFSEYDYYRLQGIDPINPLDLIKSYTDTYNTNEIHVGAYMDFIHKPREQAITQLMNMASKGFVAYDKENEIAYVQQKLFDYLDARYGSTDYDVISFNSTTTFESNAELNIQNYDLKVNGVPEIIVSDSQKVFIYPTDQEIVVKKNRDFLFSGRVHAGLFDFYAKDCSFEYDTFRLNMPQIDSISFMVRQMNDSVAENTPLPYVKVRNVLANLSGKLWIDVPSNKSGLKSYPEYPVFVSLDDSYVFYDYPWIEEGAYKRENFYYQVDPFELDSLDNFTTEGLKFKGFLASGEIFPIIEKELIVLPDYSLGFETVTPEKGWPVYNSKGTYFSDVKLSNKGLQGVGQLDYITTSSIASNFMFYPDSLVALAEDFSINSQLSRVEYPSVLADSIDQFWLVDTNIMFVRNTVRPFNMYDHQSQLEGELKISTDGVEGTGFFSFGNAELFSNLYYFNHHVINSDTTDFNLYTRETNELAFSTTQYRTTIDLEERKGFFKSNGLNSLLSMPFNQYISLMDEIEWKMDEHELLLSNKIAQRIPDIEQKSLKELMDVDFRGSEFISTHPDQDSLQFFSLSARYDMLNYVIYAEDVKLIKVADAAIFPANGDVKILANAKMETLEKAFIIADTANKHHTIYNAKVDIASRHVYNGEGSIDYIDYLGTPQEIILHTISVDTLGKTYAFGKISEDELFFLSPDFFFTGIVKIKSDRKNYRFGGGFALNQDCIYESRQWVKFDTIIDPENIHFPVVRNPVNIEQGDLTTGIYYSVMDKRIYPRFFNPKIDSLDQSLFSANGVLRFDSIYREFRLGSPLAVRNISKEGNLLSLSLDQCILFGRGAYNLGSPDPYIRVNAFGDFVHMLIPDSTNMHVFLTLDFIFDENAMELMADSIRLANLQGVNVGSQFIKNTMISKLGKAKADEIMNDFSLYGIARKLPEELIHSVFLNDVNLKWNSRSKSFISEGKIGIASFGEQQINKYVNGIIEIEKGRSGDEISLYLEINERAWYYFNYKSNVLQVISSDQRFNDRVSELKEDNRIYKDKEAEERFEFVISTKRKKVDFLRKIEEAKKPLY